MEPVQLGTDLRLHVTGITGTTRIDVAEFVTITDGELVTGNVTEVARLQASDGEVQDPVVVLPDWASDNDWLVVSATRGDHASLPVFRYVTNVWPENGTNGLLFTMLLDELDPIPGIYMDNDINSDLTLPIHLLGGETIHMEVAAEVEGGEVRMAVVSPDQDSDPPTEGDATADVVAWSTDTWEVTIFEPKLVGLTSLFTWSYDSIPPLSESSWCVDADGDHYGDPERCSASLYAAALDVAADRVDCDDADPAVAPAGFDDCNDASDQDCSGTARACDEPPPGAADLASFAWAEVRWGGEVPENLMSAAAADLTGDGNPDLVMDLGNEVIVLPDPSLGPVDAAAATLRIIGDLPSLHVPENPSADFDGDGIATVLLADPLATAESGAIYALETVAGMLSVHDLPQGWVGASSVTPIGEGVFAGTDLTGDGLADAVLTVGGSAPAQIVVSGLPESLAAPVESGRLVATPYGPAGAVHAEFDLDGDGLADVFTHAEDGALGWVFTGPILGTLDAADAWITVTGADALDGTTSDDVDGDGRADLWLVDPATDAGYFGGRAALAHQLVGGEIALAYLVDEVIGTMENPIDSFSAPGDFLGDGGPDFLVGSQRAHNGEGAVWPLRGPLSGSNVTALLPEVWFGGSVGYDITALGDFDSDGAPDVAVFGDDVLFIVTGGFP